MARAFCLNTRATSCSAKRLGTDPLLIAAQVTPGPALFDADAQILAAYRFQLGPRQQAVVINNPFRGQA
jgi:hypothetical protein